MKKIILLTFLITALGCQKNPPEPTELYNKYRNSVALIQNSYYFKTSLDNLNSFTLSRMTNLFFLKTNKKQDKTQE